VRSVADRSEPQGGPGLLPVRGAGADMLPAPADVRRLLDLTSRPFGAARAAAPASGACARTSLIEVVR